MKRRRHSRGGAVLEFALTGAPMLFAFLVIAEMGRAMWTCQTLTYAAHEVNHYVAVHGTHCGGANGCTLTVGSVATAAAHYAMGLNPGALRICLTSLTTSYSCNTITSYKSNRNPWPPTTDNTVGTTIQLRLEYQFKSALAVLWPGARPVSFATYNMGANSKQRVLF